MGIGPRLIGRRAMVVGGAVLTSALYLPLGATALDRPTRSELAGLGDEFERLRRRCARQGHRVRQLNARAEEIATNRGIPLTLPGNRRNGALDADRTELGCDRAWARWSATVDEVAALADRIIRYPARSLDDIVIKFAALEWGLLDDGVVMDSSVRRQIIAFRRNLISLGSPAGRA